MKRKFSKSTNSDAVNNADAGESSVNGGDTQNRKGGKGRQNPKS